MSLADARTELVLDGVAARALEGVVRAERYADTRLMRCGAPSADIRHAPDDAALLDSQLLYGELFDVLAEADGFAFGQARRDGYVGHVRVEKLAADSPLPTHRVKAARTYGFAEPDLRSQARGLYSMNALLEAGEREGRFLNTDAGFVFEGHLAPIGQFEADPVEVAERFLGAPYLWGGRESLGLDCSGLVQQAFLACGQACPRDADQQAGLGRQVEARDLRRGDLVCWRGHIAMMIDRERIIHANGFHAAVVVEPLAEAVERNAAGPMGRPTGYRRV
jgi:hypothetical protein